MVYYSHENLASVIVIKMLLCNNIGIMDENDVIIQR